MLCREAPAEVMLLRRGATWLTWSATLAVPVATAKPPAITVLLDSVDFSGTTHCGIGVASGAATGVRYRLASRLRRRSRPAESTSPPVPESRILRHMAKAAAAPALSPLLCSLRTVELGKPAPASAPMLKQRETMAANSFSLGAVAYRSTQASAQSRLRARSASAWARVIAAPGLTPCVLP